MNEHDRMISIALDQLHYLVKWCKVEPTQRLSVLGYSNYHQFQELKALASADLTYSNFYLENYDEANN